MTVCSGKTGVGITCAFMRSSLMITCFDKRKNDGHVEVPDLITPGRWHFLCITHTHRQIRGSKLDVYLNAELRQSLRLSYPNTALMAPVVKAYLGMRESNGTNALRVLLGPTALFGQALPASIISNIHSVDEYDALVFQFNSFISSSSTSSGSGAAGAAGASGSSSDGLLLAYDARHSDRLKGLCYDSSGNEHHASAASAGVRLRHAGTFKQAVAQLGGPLICLPLLVSSVPSGSPKNSNGTASANGGAETMPTIQFDEDAKFLKQMGDLIARPVGVKCIPKVILLIAEIMRHSLVNKFIFRRSQGVRLMALLMRSLPHRYFTADLFTAIDRLRSAVISDRILADEIYKFLLFNFRIWVNASVELQATVFDKLEIMTRKDSSNLSPVATRHFLRCLSWIYWRYPSVTTLSRARVLSDEDVTALRKRVLTMLRIVLCESPPQKSSSSVIAFASKGKEVKTQLSYESTRTLIFCMIGKPSHPMVPGMNVDGTPALSDTNGGAGQQAGQSHQSSPGSTPTASADSGAPKTMTEGEQEGGTVIENVPEADLPDLLQLLVELSVQPTAPAGMLDLFGRLGGLRIWLPLLEFPNDKIRVATLRLLRTYLFLKCGCTSDPESVNNPDRIQLSIGDSYLIMHALRPEERPVSMGVYSEVLQMILGIQVTENDMKTMDDKAETFDALIDEDILARATVWHGNMMPAFLGLVRCSSVTIRMVAIRHLKILFASSTPASAVNRQVLIFGSISNMDGTATESSTTEQVPIIEAILSLRGDGQAHEPSHAQAPLNLCGIEITGCTGVPMGQLREMVLNPEEAEVTRVNALYSIIMRDDIDFVKSLLSIQGEDERKKNGNAKSFDEMPKRLKLAAIELMATFQPNGCVDYITLASYDVISSMICLEVKTNEIAWFLLQDPFTTLSRFITSSHELEVVVVSLLKTTLDKINEMLSAEMNLRVSEGTPTRESILWCNAESLASLAAAVVLHYDPDTLGQVDPATLVAPASGENGNGHTNSPDGNNLIYWKCERAIWHEAELVDSILGIWQHFAAHFHSASDASFARRSSSAVPRRNSAASRDAGSHSPPPGSYGSNRTARDTSSSRTNSGGKLGFGFNLLPSAVSTVASGPPSSGGHVPTPVGSNISARPHPGGPMRQILQLLLRSLYLVLLSDSKDKSDASSSNELSAVAQLQLPPNSVFAARINKLEYFINAMGLGREITQYESSFAPSSRFGSSNSSTVSAGLVTTSRSVKATPGDETTLLLWLVPELAQLIDRVRRKFWSDSAVRLAGILASLVPVPLRSSDELTALLAQTDFATNNSEVRRRDMFYHEQMAHSRDIRALRRATMFEVEQEAKTRAKAEIERISRFTRTAETSNDCDDIVWLQRVKAKDIDDWMKLRVMVKWGIRHVWGKRNYTDGGFTDTGDSGVVGLSGDNEFWRIDFYTSSNWIRCRLLPDTDDTAMLHNDKEIASVIESDLMTHVSEDMSAAASVGSIVIDDAALEATDLLQTARDQLLEDEEEESGDGNGAESDPSYVGLARRISDVGYLDDDTGNMQAEHDIGANLAVQDQELAVGDVRPNAEEDHSLHDVQISAAPSSANSETSVPDYSDFSSIPTRFNRAASVEIAAMSVKSAKGRIGTISSRFSSGIMRLATNRPTKQEQAFQSTEVPSSTTSSSSAAPPKISIPEEMPETLKTEDDDATGGANGNDTPSTTASSNGKPSASPVTSDAVNPAGSTTPSTKSTKGFPSKHDHWKTLGSPFKTNAYLVLPSGILVYGILRIAVSTIAFDGEHVTTLKGLADAFNHLLEDRGSGQRRGRDVPGAYVAQLKRRIWGVRVIRVIHRRRFLMDGQNGLEIFFVDGSSCMFGFNSHGEADLVYATLRERKPPCLMKWSKRLLTAERMFSKSKWTDMWVRREISNFEYLMALNMSASRSYNDIAQYPIFPWVIKDYDSPELLLDDPEVYRDLRRPIGAQTLEGIQRAKETYKATAGSAADPSVQTLPPYHYSNPNSHMLSVLYFLVRLSPFTNAALGGSEGGNSANGNGNALTAMFNSIDDAFRMCTSDEKRAFELTPEFFYLPDFLESRRNKMLARHFSDEDGDQERNAFGLGRDVTLPRWAKSPHDFVRQHRLALESDYVSENLHHWIDLVFGYKQSGTSSVEALNAYHIACYPERLDLSTSSVAVRSKLSRRGTCPMQLFRRPHPSRMTQDEALEARYPASHAVAVLSSRRQVRRHDLASKHTAPVTAIRFSNAWNHGLVGLGAGPALGSGTGIGAHSTGSSDHGMVVYTSDAQGVVLAKRYLNAVADQARSCPFSLVDVDQWWKLPAGSLVEQGVVFYEQMISCGYWDGSWRIHWSADGELLQRIAFHKKPILCMARSEDDFTGDLALAFGSEDCTVSVWALSKAAATRSRRMFASKKDLPVGGLPWVLLVGHTSPVVAVALNVDLDVVVSSSKENTILLHSLRGAAPLHSIAISPPPSVYSSSSVVTDLVISTTGDTLIHLITTEALAPSRHLTRSNSIFSDDKSRFSLLGNSSGSSSASESATATEHVQQSELYLLSINGHIVAHKKLTNADSTEQLLLRQGVLFTRSSEYIITASGGKDAAIDVRDAGDPSRVVRRIECKRATADLTCISMSQDERCLLCGYEDGAVIAYALHFGIADGCKSAGSLEKKAREREAEAIALANKRDELKNKRDEMLPSFLRGTNGSASQTLWMKQGGKAAMPPESLLDVMQGHYSLLKQNCVSDEPAYEALLLDLWRAIYSQEHLQRRSSLHVPIAEENLLNFSDSESDSGGVDTKEIGEYERVGETWSRLGFQRPDPTTDFRAGGMLSLQCLVYFASHYPSHAVRMVTSQVPGSHDNTYPWGPAGINVTCMVARLFWKFDGELVRERQPNWPLFADPDALYKIFSEGKSPARWWWCC